jgi:hypothetical protein
MDKSDVSGLSIETNIIGFQFLEMHLQLMEMHLHFKKIQNQFLEMLNQFWK